jgi:translocation and assembly module TamB
VLSKRSRLNAQLTSSDLHEFAALAAAFGVDTGASGDASPLRDLGGSARFDGQILGAPSDPQIQGRLVASNLQVRNTRWRTLQVSVDASANSVSLRNGTATDAQNGQIGFRLDAALNRWSFNRSAALSAQLTAKEISVDELQRIANSSYPVSGSVTADISLRGSAEHPEGQGTLTISRAKAWDEDINSFAVNFSGDGNAIRSNIQMTTAAGSATANVNYQPGSQTYDVDVKSSGVKLENLRAAQIQSLGVSGDVAFAASGHGTLSNPQLAATLQVPQLRIRDWVVSDVQASLNSAGQRATFTLSTRADQASIQARGEVALSGNYPATASLEVRAMPVALVLAKYLRADQNVQGETDLQATFGGPLKNPDAVTAQLEISKLNLVYQSANLALVPPLRLKYANGLATLDRAEFKGTGTNVSIAGAIPIKSAQPLNVSADGTLDLALLQGWESDLRSSGKLTVNLSARGELAHPSLQGQIHLADARLATESIPIGLDGINGVLQFAGNRIDITQFSGSAGGGTVSAHGFMTYGDPSSFNVGLDVKSVRVRYPEGIRSIVSGNLALNGSQSASRLTGRLLVDRLSFTQQFDLANFLGQFGADSGPTASSSLAQKMALNVSVATGQEEKLSNSKVNIEGSANLTLIGTAAYPVILGRTALTGGELFFMGKRYEIQNGTIEFVNPVRTTPVLNLNVFTTVQQYNIGLNFVGPLDKLRTNYTSDPPLPSADIIHLVAFGKTSEQSAASPSTPAALGAQSVLAQGVSGQISNRLEQLTGISQLTLNPLSNSQTNPGSQVAIQQHITGNLLLTFSTDVTSTQNQSVQVQYRAKKNLSISVLRDQYGGYAADVRIHKTF